MSNATIRTRPPFPGFLLAVGGQCRKVGKSTLIADIIAAFPNRNWTAVKITPYAESGCPINGQSCGCAPEGHPYAIHEETELGPGTDTSRFLAAGASRALWLETKENRLSEALPALAVELARAQYVIIESDALMKFWKASLFLMVLDPANPDFKSSARANLPLADAFVLRSPFALSGATDPDSAAVAEKPHFLQRIGSPLPIELRQFLSGSIL
jgi:molybdopterin-guanine dinucleotide biosynthesis protein